MERRLFVGVLGHRNSGKSRTWNELFGKRVRTSTQARLLELRPKKFVEVFLISGSPEERKAYASDILENQTARIVLCSIQYTEKVYDTLEYVTKENFDIFVQWLNPGYSDSTTYFDRLGIAQQLLATKATLALRDGAVPPSPRVQEIKEFIYGWAAFTGLLRPTSDYR